MAFKDHRDFFEVLEKEGELARITQEVDWDLEVGAIGRRTYETEGPCLLFEKIKDYPKGFRISNGTTGTWSRVALSMGLPRKAPVREIYQAYEKGLEKKIPPRIIKKENAPCKENVMIGDQVDLFKFPSPMIHEGDGGRYIGTWDLVVTKDPVTGWTNWGMYRFMVHTKDWLTGWPQSTSQLAFVFNERYRPKNQPMPVALVIGTDPISHILATAPLRLQENEVEYSGGLTAGPYVALATSVSIPAQNPAEFRELLGKALAIDLQASPENRLVNLLSQRKARWLLEHIEDYFLLEEAP